MLTVRDVVRDGMFMLMWMKAESKERCTLPTSGGWRRRISGVTHCFGGKSYRRAHSNQHSPLLPLPR